MFHIIRSHQTHKAGFILKGFTLKGIQPRPNRFGMDSHHRYHMERYKQRLGKRGEALAEQYLRRKGFQIIRRNYRYGHKEIDLICKDKNTIVFVEVKAGRSKNFGAPHERVNLKKQKNLIEAAYDFIQKENVTGCDFRFDVMSISFERKREIVDHITNAFMVT